MCGRLAHGSAIRARIRPGWLRQSRGIRRAQRQADELQAERVVHPGVAVGRDAPLTSREREYAAPVATERVTGGQALVRARVGEGVEVIFGLPGVQLDWLFDALYEARDRLRVYHVRHEQTTAYMADGYARTTGRVGVCAVVPGPGVLNAGAALATAYACSSQVLCV